MAIRIFGSQSVNRGDVVAVTGVLTTWLGQRVVVNADVTVVDTGASGPMPLLMRVGDLGGVMPGPNQGTVKSGRGAGNAGMLLMCKSCAGIVLF